MDLELDTLHLMSRYAMKPEKAATTISKSAEYSGYARRIRKATKSLLAGGEEFPEHIKDAFNAYASALASHYTFLDQTETIQKEYEGLPTGKKATSRPPLSDEAISGLTKHLLAAPPDPSTAVKKGLNVRIHKRKSGAKQDK